MDQPQDIQATQAAGDKKQAKRSRKWLSLSLRLLVAVVGVGYILWVVQWTDRVELAKGFEMPDGTVLAESRTVPISSDEVKKGLATGVFRVTVQGQAQPLVLVMPDAAGADGSGETVDAPSFIFRPGVVRTVSEARLDLVIYALLGVSIVLPFQAVRWKLLLIARQMQVPFWKVQRLVLVGMFFNICMPGTTGGDVVKAYYAAAKNDRRTDAVMSVVVDRVLGLLGLILLAGVVGLFMLDDPLARQITIYIWSCAAIGAVGATVYFSGRLRRQLGLEWIIRRLPGRGFLQNIDAAVVAYRHHPLTLGTGLALSMGNHTALAGAAALAGYALGMQTDFGVLMTVLPVVIFAAALPISPQGLGVMEYLAIEMLMSPGEATANQIVGTLMLFRLFVIFYGLACAASLIGSNIHVQAAAKEMESDEQQAAPTGDMPA